VRGCFELYMCRMCTIIRLTTSVWPSVYGWKAVDLVSLVSNIDQRLDQNVLRNLLSRSEMIDCGIPKCTHTRSKKSLAVASDVIFFLQAIIMDIFENRSTTTNDLDICWIHMHPLLINNVSQILNLGYAKSAFLQIGTQLVLP
jgi:hypothetical protein